MKFVGFEYCEVRNENEKMNGKKEMGTKLDAVGIWLYLL